MYAVKSQDFDFSLFYKSNFHPFLGRGYTTTTTTTTTTAAAAQQLLSYLDFQ